VKKNNKNFVLYPNASADMLAFFLGKNDSKKPLA
jgi:hypothetical protein